MKLRQETKHRGPLLTSCFSSFWKSLKLSDLSYSNMFTQNLSHSLFLCMNNILDTFYITMGKDQTIRYETVQKSVFRLQVVKVRTVPTSPQGRNQKHKGSEDNYFQRVPIPCFFPVARLLMS